jgi:hypothetical protein
MSHQAEKLVSLMDEKKKGGSMIKERLATVTAIVTLTIATFDFYQKLKTQQSNEEMIISSYESLIKECIGR